MLFHGQGGGGGGEISGGSGAPADDGFGLVLVS
jgi:hypothetical protein